VSLHLTRPADERPLAAPPALTHRWLGTASGVLILAWFVSGLVMLYVPFPKLDTDERVSRQARCSPTPSP
jgi:hypothetical protein